MKYLNYLFIGLLLVSCGGSNDDDGNDLDTNCRFVGIETGVCPTGTLVPWFGKKNLMELH